MVVASGGGVVHQGVPGVTGGGGDGGGEGDGHEAQTFALKVLHGGAHVFFHQLGHLVLRHGQGVVGRRRRLVSVGASRGSAAGGGLDAVTSSLIKTSQITIIIIIILYYFLRLDREEDGKRRESQKKKKKEKSFVRVCERERKRNLRKWARVLLFKLSFYGD